MNFVIYAFSYLMGAIPVGVIVGRMHGVDITQVGSKNVGATNVWRSLGAKAGLLVFSLDVIKGLVPALLGAHYFHDQQQAFVCGVLAILGHSLSPFIGFKGGKGIATGLGAMLGSSPLVAISALSVFFLLFFATMYVSLASVAAAISITAFAFVYREPTTLKIAYFFLGMFVMYRHRSNIERLINGTERKFSFKKSSSEDKNSDATPVGDQSLADIGEIIDTSSVRDSS